MTDFQSGVNNAGYFGPSFEIATVTEPSTTVSAGIAGLMGIGYARRRRTKAA